MFFLNLGSRIFDRNPPKLYSIVLTLTPLNSYYDTLQNSVSIFTLTEVFLRWVTIHLNQENIEFSQKL